MSLRNRIIEYLKLEHPRIVHAGELEKMAFDSGYMASNAGRRCRELENEGIIKVILDQKGCAQYQYIERYVPPIMVADKSIFYKNLQGRLL